MVLLEAVRDAAREAVLAGSMRLNAELVGSWCHVADASCTELPDARPKRQTRHVPDDPEAEARLSWGDEVLLRYRYQDGRVQAAIPMRVVDDSDDILVAWLADDTPVRYWALSDGRDPRSVPLERRFDQRMSTAARRWKGGVLRAIPTREPFQVLHFWDDDRTFKGWYVNLEAPKTRSGSRLDTVDWHLDLWINADRTYAWKDEDEAEAALEAGHLLEHALAAARSTGQSIIDRLTDWPTQIGDWRSFAPPPEWSVPTLPDDWDDPAWSEGRR